MAGGAARKAIFGAAGLAAAYFLLASILAWPPFRATPAYYKNVQGGQQIYTCNGGEGPQLPITFSADGKVAIVTVNGQPMALEFQGFESPFFEVYASGQWKLTLDPEANLQGPGGLRLSNCY